MFQRLKSKIMGNCSPDSPGTKLNLKVDTTATRKRADDNFRRWINIPQIGQIPGKRSGHAVVALDNKAFLFGGCGDDSDCLDDYFCFDFNSHYWRNLRCRGQGPAARASFELTLGCTDGTIIIAGGTAKDGLHGDIYEYNMFTREWKELIFEEGQDILKEFLASYGQTLRAFEGCMIGFGGSTGTSYTNATVRMNLRTLKCEKLQVTGATPSPRYKHQSIIVGEKMFILGGGNYRPRTEKIDVFCLGLYSCQWTQPPTEGTAPTARVAHAAIHDKVSNSVFVWGGFNENLERLNDFFCLDINSMRWSEISSDDGVVPPARAFHAAAIHDSTLFIFGGADGEKRFADVWAYRFRASPPSLMVLAARSPAITPLATPMATPKVGRSRECSSAQSQMPHSRSKAGSMCVSHPLGATGNIITADSIMEALGELSLAENGYVKKSSRERKRSPSHSRRISPFGKNDIENTICEEMKDSSINFIIPGEGILPSEVLTGIQGLAFGADSFCHGLPKESRPGIADESREKESYPQKY